MIHSVNEVFTSSDINGKREIYWKLESLDRKLDGLDVAGNWIEKTLWWYFCSGVKIKTVLLISNIFFLKLYPAAASGLYPGRFWRPAEPRN